jgi:hypothetical protein
MTNGSTGDTKVAIISDEQTCRATPSEVFVASKYSVIFQNIGAGTVTVLFPEDSPLPNKAITLTDSGDGSQQSISIAADEKTIISYDVYNHDNRALASDEQRPIIIVYPDLTR